MQLPSKSRHEYKSTEFGTSVGAATSASNPHLGPIWMPSLSAPRRRRGRAPSAGPMMPPSCRLASSSYTWPTQRPLPRPRSSELPSELRTSRTRTSLRAADLGIPPPLCHCHTMAPIPNLLPQRPTRSTTLISRSRASLTSNNRSNGSECSSIAKCHRRRRQIHALPSQAQLPPSHRMASTLLSRARADQVGTIPRRRP